MRRKWATLRRLSASERRVLSQAVVLLPLTSLALRLFGFRRWQAVLAAFTPESPALGGEVASEHIRETARMVRLAATRGLSRPSCLPRSLVLWFLLRRQGIDGRLRLGVRKQGTEMDAHAWVEWEGFVLNDPRSVRTRFVPFETSGVPGK